MPNVYFTEGGGELHNTWELLKSNIGNHVDMGLGGVFFQARQKNDISISQIQQFSTP